MRKFSNFDEMFTLNHLLLIAVSFWCGKIWYIQFGDRKNAKTAQIAPKYPCYQCEFGIVLTELDWIGTSNFNGPINTHFMCMQKMHDVQTPKVLLFSQISIFSF